MHSSSQAPDRWSRYQGSKSYLSKSERAKVIQWLVAQKAWDISDLEVYLIDLGWSELPQRRRNESFLESRKWRASRRRMENYLL